MDLNKGVNSVKYAARVWTTTPAGSQPADTCLPSASPPAVSPLSPNPPGSQGTGRGAAAHSGVGGSRGTGGGLAAPPSNTLCFLRKSG